MDETTYQEYRTETLSRKGCKGKVRNSVGVYDIYKKIRKNNWYDIGRPLKEKEFYSIIRGINDLLAQEVAQGNKITFPCRMGELELKKSKRGVSIVEGELKITYPVDWNKTLQLWYDDDEARKDKILIRHENNYVYKIKYNNYTATYNNKIFYQFAVNSFIKEALSKNIKRGKVDTLWETTYNEK